MKLGTLLLRNAAIGLTQLEAALRNQVLYGGRLGTNLVELGHLDLETLSTYLSELTGSPVATPTLLDDADSQLLERLGADEAHAFRAMPLGFLGSGTDTVAVAMVDPTDTEAIDMLRQRLGARVTPYVVPELRILYYLEKHYGLPRRARFIRTGPPGSEPDAPAASPSRPVDERRKVQPSGGIAMPPAFTLEPRRRRTSSQSAVVAPVQPVSSHGAASEQIDTATHRDHIADAFVHYAQGRCDALVLFLIRDGNAVGWRGYVAPPRTSAKPIEQISLPLGGASALQAAHDSGQIFIGPPPSAARPVETALWTALGSDPAPAEVFVLPVQVKQRSVNLIYGHVLSGRPPGELIDELADLAARAQAAYMRLIRQARGG
jgi:hypothetical protein